MKIDNIPSTYWHSTKGTISITACQLHHIPINHALFVLWTDEETEAKESYIFFLHGQDHT